MTVSTNGEISFGILFEEGYEFPWDDEKYDNDIGEWWLEVNEYKPPVEIFDERGMYIDGKAPSKNALEEYFEHRSKFIGEHPLPIEQVNVCSDEYPRYIIAIPGIGHCARRGYPEVFNPLDLPELITEEKVQALIDFCETYLHDPDGWCEFPEMTPKWYLSSFWG
jgi:hypothetical protein